MLRSSFVKLLQFLNVSFVFPTPVVSKLLKFNCFKLEQPWNVAYIDVNLSLVFQFDIFNVSRAVQPENVWCVVVKFCTSQSFKSSDFRLLQSANVFAMFVILVAVTPDKLSSFNKLQLKNKHLILFFNLKLLIFKHSRFLQPWNIKSKLFVFVVSKWLRSRLVSLLQSRNIYDMYITLLVLKLLISRFVKFVHPENIFVKLTEAEVSQLDRSKLSRLAQFWKMPSSENALLLQKSFTWLVLKLLTSKVMRLLQP